LNRVGNTRVWRRAGPGMAKRCEQGQIGTFQFRLPVEIPRPDRVTKTPCGVRPMSIGRCGPGELLRRYQPRGHAPLPGIDIPPHGLSRGAESERRLAVFLNTVSPSQGEAPAEPHPCRERFIDPCCAAKTLASDHSGDQRSAARQEPRRPESSTVFSQNFREPQGHWASNLRLMRCRYSEGVRRGGWISASGGGAESEGAGEVVEQGIEDQGQW
jgi:hypothetical protein